MDLLAGGVKKTMLRRQNAADQIAEVLHERILAGELRSGEPLREADLSTEFGVARNTMREALRLLTTEGLATHTVHHGVRVRSFTTEEVRDIYQLRRLLESAVASKAGRLTPEQKAAMRAVIDQGAKARKAGNGQGWMTANVNFHRLLVRTLGIRRLDQVFDQLMRELRLVRITLERSPDEGGDEEDRQLIDALDNDDDGTKYLLALNEYLDSSLSHILQEMTSAAKDSPGG